MYARVTALQAAQNALTGRMRPAGRSLPTSALMHKYKNAKHCKVFIYCKKQ